MIISRLYWLVLNATANDYEDIETIQADVGIWCAEYGESYSHNAVLVALADLIDNGFISAYSLSPSGPAIRRGVASTREILLPNTYFLATASGREAASRDFQL